MTEGRGHTIEGPKTVEIRPPSVRSETLNVVKAAAAIVVIAAAYVFRPALGDPSVDRQAGRSSIALLPYQKLVSQASPADQRIFREMQEGLLEAERIRAATGQWPDVETLVAAGIPPFAPDRTQKVEYTWTSTRQDWVTNYLGVPADRGAPAWVLVILEPEPGAPPDPAPNDETHHRLPDGTTLHVSVWTIPEEQRRSGLAALRLPQNEGWTQLLVGSNAE